ncbi:MAG: c-type cytochrome [Phycisphaerales bacterium]
MSRVNEKHESTVERANRRAWFGLTAAAGVGILFATAASIVGCQEESEDDISISPAMLQPNLADLTSPVARGEYLVSTIGCSDCHTPFKMGPHGLEKDWSRLLSGHPEDFVMSAAPVMPEGWLGAFTVTNTAFSGPWGISYAANLTPDVQTGLGIWTEEMFVNAIRQGKHMGLSRTIMPPMPWEYYSKLTDEDLRAIYAYLRTIPAVENDVPEYQPPYDPEDHPYG